MEKIGEKFEEIKPELKEKEPKISYHFFYTPHMTAEDYKNLAAAFAKTDIYVPEVVFLSPLFQELFQGIANGEITPEEVLGSEAASQPGRERELEIIYDSKKPILLADIAYDDALVKEFEKAESFGQKAKEFFMSGHFKESLEQLYSYLKGYAEVQIKREEKIKINLEAKLKEFLKNNPDYAKKKDLRVLIRLGDFHTKIYQEFKKEKRPVSREFNELPMVYSSLVEAKRRIVFDKEISDELMARGIIETLIEPYLDQLTSDTVKSQAVNRKISTQLSLKDIERISKNYAKNPKTDIIAELKKFKIRIPKSEEEMDERLDTGY